MTVILLKDTVAAWLSQLIPFLLISVPYIEEESNENSYNIFFSRLKDKPLSPSVQGIQRSVGTTASVQGMDE